MSTAEKIIHKLESLEEDRLVKLLEYIEFLAYQQDKEKDEGLQVAKDRSDAFDQGNTQPLSKKEFWNNLQKKLG